ncbi:hypothetical protein KW807_02065 [Candidatus Parcubacteria bacterium]|nr:hypothetical protein [Candidatus Parcubacteria bacterium]
MTQKLVTKPGLNEFDQGLIIASYFGFMPVSAPKVLDKDIEVARTSNSEPYFDAVEKASLIRHYLENNFSSLPHPLAMIYKQPVVKKRIPGYGLHFIGASGGIAEATLIRTALSMLSEAGYKNLRVDLNCVGDKESLAVYERELGNYVKKFGQSLNAPLKESLKADLFNLFRHEDEEMIRLRVGAPSSITFLSSQSRLHFKEVLEYLEALGIEFRLAPELIGEKNHVSHTVFAIKSVGSASPELEVTEETLAVGYRYSRLGRKMGLRKEIPMAGCSIFSTPGKELGKKVYKQLPRPKFYLVQLGQMAKVKTLALIELLRSHKIPVHHFLGKDKLAVQLANAESLQVGYLIIIGQKEALDGTATIRNVTTRAQDTIPLEMLPQYLKDIHL